MSDTDLSPSYFLANVVALEIFDRNNKKNPIHKRKKFQTKGKERCHSPLSIVQTIVYTS
jgi:hypothetical protein